MKFIGIVGSLNSHSYNKLLMAEVRKLLPKGSSFTEVRFDDLPHFNQDLEDNFPKAATKLKNAIRGGDAVVIVTPEYNRSIPGALKNAIDWTSRPTKDNPWVRKPVFIMSASSGNNVGPANAQYHLKQVLLYLDALVLGQPEFFLPRAQDMFDTRGRLTDEKSKKHLAEALTAFITFVRQVQPKRKG